MNMKGLAFGAAALFALSMPSEAAVVFDNGGPGYFFGGYETTRWVQAEDFSFAAATTVTGAGVYLAGFAGIGAWDGFFTYYIYADASGVPGAILQSGSVTPTVTNTFIPWCCIGDAYLFEFDLTADFAAAAGVTYWLGIHASEDFDRDDVYWVESAFLLNATARGWESKGGPNGPWDNQSIDSERAFFLTGVREVTVPEPASLALLGMGLLGLGFAARRRVTG